jgi:hypothetical protein
MRPAGCFAVVPLVLSDFEYVVRLRDCPTHTDTTEQPLESSV